MHTDGTQATLPNRGHPEPTSSEGILNGEVKAGRASIVNKAVRYYECTLSHHF